MENTSSENAGSFYCQTCGAELSDEDITNGFCPNCGAMLTFFFDIAGLPLWE